MIKYNAIDGRLILSSAFLRSDIMMIRTLFFLAPLLIAGLACHSDKGASELAAGMLPQQSGSSLVKPSGSTIATRVAMPVHWERLPLPANSFGAYLRDFPVLSHGSRVMLYDGSAKGTQSIHAAVLDIDIGKRDLQQCADAVMRLRAEYLYKQGRYNEIHFNFTNGFNCSYSKWREGYRVAVNGNQTSWVRNAGPDNSYASFRKYLDLVFTYAGSLSLSKELVKVNVADMKVGDVFIRGGSPGHAVIVVDMARDKRSGEKYFLIAQSYMPAQSIHILHTTNSEAVSPWYALNFGNTLYTPQWTFSATELMRFKE